jgi:hypothetical protein
MNPAATKSRCDNCRDRVAEIFAGTSSLNAIVDGRYRNADLCRDFLHHLSVRQALNDDDLRLP